ncbi:MAG: ABC transporter permease, partial [Candidatus Nealsonbacteria bacterium]|nr:ABC transporter permease [Candidatus Nealsonbacteria bacterium]
VIHSVIDRAFNRGVQGYDVIVGAKGGQWQLVQNSVFYLGQSLEKNLPESYYREFVEGRFAPAVEFAIPICTGHDYKGSPAVATVPEMFEKLTDGKGEKYTWHQGKNFKHENKYDAVVGYEAAVREELEVGSTFEPVASADGKGGKAHKDTAFTVVGILNPTGTPNDRAVFMNIKGFWECPAHQQEESATQAYLRGSDNEGDSDHPEESRPAEDRAPLAEEAGHEDHKHVRREVTAILIRTKILADTDEEPDSDFMFLAMGMVDAINEGNDAQAVHPARVIRNFFNKVVGNVQLLLLVLAVLVVVVAGIGIMVSIYNSMNDRRHDIAVMRALGASRAVVMTVILLESILLSLGGGALGLLLGHGLVGAMSPTIADQLGVPISALDFQWNELVLIPGLTILATLVGFLPAISAYRTDVAKSLTAAP